MFFIDFFENLRYNNFLEVKQMISVRPFLKSDREQIEKICIENAGCKDAKEDTKRFVLLMNCAYYLENDPENSFVAVDDYGNVVGYAVCCENYNNYEKVFLEKYVTQAAMLSARRYVDSKINMLKFGMYRKDYPAHFFLNVSLENQNMGIGGLLITTVKAHLRKKYVRGVMIVCDDDNEELIRFFENNGFKSLITTKFGRAMALQYEN